jgi:hypothetical protein
MSFDVYSYTQVYTPQDMFNQAFLKEEATINYPFICYQIKSTSLKEQTVGSIVSRNKGLALSNITARPYPQLNEIEYATNALDNTRIKTAIKLPLTLNITFWFVTNEPSQYEEFLLAWYELYPNKLSGVVDADDSGTPFPFHFHPNTQDLSYPELDLSDEKGKIYIGEFSATIDLQVGNVIDRAAIQPETLEGQIKDEVLPVNPISSTTGFSDAATISPPSVIKLTIQR